MTNPGPNVANHSQGADWNGENGNVTSVGNCGSLSMGPWGTYDQGGNVADLSAAASRCTVLSQLSGMRCE